MLSAIRALSPWRSFLVSLAVWALCQQLSCITLLAISLGHAFPCPVELPWPHETATNCRPSLLFPSVASAPPGAQAAQFDVDAAYRRIPTLFNHWKFLVVSVTNLANNNTEYFIDMAHPFGLKSAGGNLGYAMDATITILNHTLTPAFIAKWVDDIVVVRHPSRIVDGSPCYDLSFQQICAIFNELGWPLSPEKIRQFAPSVRYIGFDWDFPSRMVLLPEEKRLKFLGRLTSWILSAKTCGVSTHETEKLIGSLNHITNIFPHARSSLPSIHSFLTSFRSTNRFVTRRPSHQALSDAQLWLELLSIPNAFRHLEIRPVVDPDVWVDASTEWGIALVAAGRWRAWQLMPGWKSERRDIGWAESVAIELATLHLASLLRRHVTFQVHSDNQGAIGQHSKGRSRNSQSNQCIRRSTIVMMNGAFDVAPIYVPSADNLADAPSRGKSLFESSRLPRSFDIPPELTTWLVEF